MESVSGQHAEIDALNRTLEGRFRVFKGIEANILSDGSLDLQPDERRLFEFVVASPHSQLRRVEDQTARMLAAVRTPGVAMLGHPRGRVFGSRAGVQADWARVFAAAAEREVAVEIDGNWHRQDLDYILAAQARRTALHRLFDRARATRRHSGGARHQLLERRSAVGLDGSEAGGAAFSACA